MQPLFSDTMTWSSDNFQGEELIARQHSFWARNGRLHANMSLLVRIAVRENDVKESRQFNFNKETCILVHLASEHSRHDGRMDLGQV